MALTEEQLKLQMEILASKTDSTTNPNMVYKTNATLNKGLNPDYFTGNSTKIVNAINDLAAKANQSITNAQLVADKVNNMLLDIDLTDNAVVWQETKDLMEKNTIIEGIKHILEGKQTDKILGLNASDKGKVLSVDVDENGDAVLKAVESIASSVSAVNIPYTHANVPTVKNVKTALDYVINQVLNGNTGGGELGGGFIVGDITWDMISEKPIIGSKLSIVSNRLALLDEEGTILSSVNMMTDKEVEDLIDSMGAIDNLE